MTPRKQAQEALDCLPDKIEVNPLDQKALTLRAIICRRWVYENYDIIRLALQRMADESCLLNYQARLDMIGYLLPLAKGYVHTNPGVRSTECIIEDAEAMIAAAESDEK